MFCSFLLHQKNLSSIETALQFIAPLWPRAQFFDQILCILKCIFLQRDEPVELGRVNQPVHLAREPIVVVISIDDVILPQLQLPRRARSRQ